MQRSIFLCYLRQAASTPGQQNTFPGAQAAVRLLWHGMLPGWPLLGLFADHSASCGSGWHASDATTALAAAVLAAVTMLLLKREWWFVHSPRPCNTH